MESANVVVLAGRLHLTSVQIDLSKLEPAPFTSAPNIVKLLYGSDDDDCDDNEISSPEEKPLVTPINVELSYGNDDDFKDNNAYKEGVHGDINDDKAYKEGAHGDEETIISNDHGSDKMFTYIIDWNDDEKFTVEMSDRANRGGDKIFTYIPDHGDNKNENDQKCDKKAVNHAIPAATPGSKIDTIDIIGIDNDSKDNYVSDYKTANEELYSSNDMDNNKIEQHDHKETEIVVPTVYNNARCDEERNNNGEGEIELFKIEQYKIDETNNNNNKEDENSNCKYIYKMIKETEEILNYAITEVQRMIKTKEVKENKLLFNNDDKLKIESVDININNIVKELNLMMEIELEVESKRNAYKIKTETKSELELEPEEVSSSTNKINNNIAIGNEIKINNDTDKVDIKMHTKEDIIKVAEAMEAEDVTEIHEVIGKENEVVLGQKNHNTILEKENEVVLRRKNHNTILAVSNKMEQKRKKILHDGKEFEENRNSHNKDKFHNGKKFESNRNNNMKLYKSVVNDAISAAKTDNEIESIDKPSLKVKRLTAISTSSIIIIKPTNTKQQSKKKDYLKKKNPNTKWHWQRKKKNTTAH